MLDSVSLWPMRCRNFNEFKRSLDQRNNRFPFKKSDSGLLIKIQDRFDMVDHETWNGLVNDESIFLHMDYIQAIVNSYENGLEYRFATFYEEGKLVGVAAFQITHFETSDLRSNMNRSNPIISLFTRGLIRNGQTLRYNMLICGNAFASGDHGFRFVEQIDKQRAYRAILQAIEMIMDLDQHEKDKVSAILIKDFYPEDWEFCQNFSDDKYSEFLVDPNMVMPIRADWENFDDYLEALTSKYRTKAKGVYKKAEDIVIRDFDKELLEEHKTDFQKLYDQVHFKADYRVGKLTCEAFCNLMSILGDRMILRGLFLNGKLVGFMSGFEYDGTFDAHFVGIDYALNQRYAIYPLMLYEFVREAISRKVKRISFGRTAMEIKSTVGAFPIDLKIFIKHRNAAPNHLLRLLFNYVKPADFDQRVPYKEKILSEMRLLP
jgi:predicted N-acyltransferase